MNGLRAVRPLLPYIFAVAFTGVFITPYCGVLFHCGCKPIWAGSDRWCNIHAASGPHCPFCSLGTLRFYGYVGGGVVGTQFLALLAWFRRRLVLGSVMAVVIFFAVGGLAAYWAGAHDHYVSPGVARHAALDCGSSGTQEGRRFDHGALDQLLSRYVNDQGWVDYDGLKSDRSQLNQYLDTLASAEPQEFVDRCGRLAFWINSYNAFTLADVLDDVYGKARSVRDVAGFFNRKRHAIASQQLTLDEIERRGREMGDSRIHFALVCASTSCPKLQRFAYQGGRLDAQLDGVAREFLHDENRGARMGANGHLVLSPVFKWYAGDFAGEESGMGRLFARVKATISGGDILDYVSDYASNDLQKIIREKRPAVDYLDYDWSLNAQSKHHSIAVPAR